MLLIGERPRCIILQARPKRSWPDMIDPRRRLKILCARDKGHSFMPLSVAGVNNRQPEPPPDSAIPYPGLWRISVDPERPKEGGGEKKNGLGQTEGSLAGLESWSDLDRVKKKFDQNDGSKRQKKERNQVNLADGYRPWAQNHGHATGELERVVTPMSILPKGKPTIQFQR